MVVFGLVLIGVCLALLVAEAHVSSGGALGAIAIAAGVAGIVLLLLAAGAGAAVVLLVALLAAGAASATLVLARNHLVRSLRVRPRTGREALVGHVGVVRSGGSSGAQVFLDGALWRAEPSPVHDGAGLHEGERVIVEHVNGLTLRVRKAEEWELNP
ncbi:MAG TPA: NfeD family protein [Solirubrobacteraceae bacterium]|jgi:membrane-bound serine protease (ClpP class)